MSNPEDVEDSALLVRLVEYAVVADSQFIGATETTGQGEGLDLLEIISKPAEPFDDSRLDWRIQALQILPCGGNKLESIA